MEIQEIGEPGDGGPSLLRVPSPIRAPGNLSPQSPEQHPESQERETCGDKVVRSRHVFFRGLVLPEYQDVKSHDRGGPKHSVGEHVNYDMGREPGALKGRHKVLRVDFRLQEIDNDEHQ